MRLKGESLQVPKRSILSLNGEILVRCARCAMCAHLRQTEDRDGYRLVCPECALFRDWLLTRDKWAPSPNGGPMLDRLGLEVWLQRPCCGRTLWASNEEHVSYLEQVVAPKLRERRPDESFGWSNSTLDSRLPRWMLKGSNRDEVLKGLQALRAMLPQAARSS